MNLLSEAQKKAVYEDIILRFLAVAFGVAALWVAIFLIFAYSGVLYLDIQTPALENRLASEQETETARNIAAVEEEITKLNGALLTIEKAGKRQSPYFPEILLKIGELVPSGVSLRRLSFRGQVVAIEGRADQRSDALIFKEKLEKDSLCKKLSSPLIIKEKDVNFSFSCTYLAP